jgi:hypothetical protein
MDCSGSGAKVERLPRMAEIYNEITEIADKRRKLIAEIKAKVSQVYPIQSELRDKSPNTPAPTPPECAVTSLTEAIRLGYEDNTELKDILNTLNAII